MPLSSSLVEATAKEVPAADTAPANHQSTSQEHILIETGSSSVSVAAKPKKRSGGLLETLEEDHYFACIFTSKASVHMDEEYHKISDEIAELAEKQDGFLGWESARGSDSIGITVSYWRSLESMKRWKQNSDHLEVQRKGYEKWYDAYSTRICRVEREYSVGSF